MENISTNYNKFERMTITVADLVTFTIEGDANSKTDAIEKFISHYHNNLSAFKSDPCLYLVMAQSWLKTVGYTSKISPYEKVSMMKKPFVYAYIALCKFIFKTIGYDAFRISKEVNDND